MHLLSSDSFSSLIFSFLLFSSLTLPTSAFPSVHIVESLTSKLPSTRLDISRHESLVNLRYLTEAVLHTVACHTNDLNTWFEVKDEGSWRFFEKLLPKKFSMTDFRVTAVTAEYEQETGVGVSKVCRRMPTLVFCSHLFWLVSLCLSVHMFK